MKRCIKTLLKVNKYENSAQITDEQKNINFGSTGVMSSSWIYNSKNSENRNESNKKCKKKRKENKESDRKNYTKNSNRKATIELSKSKERNFDSKIDFYKRNKNNGQEGFSQHRTYDENEKNHDKESKSLNKRVMGQAKKSAVISERNTKLR